MRRALCVVVLALLIPGLHARSEQGSAARAGERAASCSQLMALTLADTTITAAEDVTVGEFLPPGQQGRGGPTPLADLPAFCRVALTVAPAIKIEVWMPRDNWNGRFVGEGGGGYAGTISYGQIATRIRAGYAAASTDTGHVGGNGSFALNPDRSLNMALITDFSERSLREMAVKAKALINAYYGRMPVYSYWSGCSTGGRQGLMAAQRFPDEYDGLVIGAPAVNWDRLVPADLWPQIVMNELTGGPIGAAKLNAATAASVAACDGGDGVTDGIIDNPRACTFDPSALVCKAGDDASTCLSTSEADAIRKIWDGPTTPSGERLWFGLERGTPLNALAGNQPFGIAHQHFRYWIRQDPAFDWKTVTSATFERDFRESQRKFQETIGTDDPSLSGFQRSGGRMIIWHGEADELIPPRGTIHYFNRMVEANGGQAEVDRFARLYMAPGVGHCVGGVGPAPTGLFEAVVDWVERDVAPKTILAINAPGGAGRAGVPATNAATPAPQVPGRTRPLCPFPTLAKWTGSGSSNDAANFTCVPTNPRSSDFTVK